jgi:hypothetical protein
MKVPHRTRCPFFGYFFWASKKSDKKIFQKKKAMPCNGETLSAAKAMANVATFTPGERADTLKIYSKKVCFNLCIGWQEETGNWESLNLGIRDGEIP